MLSKISIRLWKVTAAAIRFAGGALYNATAKTRADPFSIPAEYARIFFPLMYLLWALALASQLVELYWLPDARPAPGLPWPAQIRWIADFVIRFGALAFGLTLLLIPATIILVNFGRLLMKLAQRIENIILPAEVREEINAAVSKAVSAATSETRKERDAAWENWVARRDEAARKGKPFNDPPPNARP